MARRKLLSPTCPHHSAAARARQQAREALDPLISYENSDPQTAPLGTQGRSEARKTRPRLATGPLFDARPNALATRSLPQLAHPLATGATRKAPTRKQALADSANRALQAAQANGTGVAVPTALLGASASSGSGLPIPAAGLGPAPGINDVGVPYNSTYASLGETPQPMGPVGADPNVPKAAPSPALSGRSSRASSRRSRR
jgi:hypothetical protein